MPYKEGNKWRASVMIDSKRHTSLHATKKAAKEWESETRKKQKSKKDLPDTALGNLVVKYLDYVESKFTPGVYKEKRTVCKRFLDYFGKYKNVYEIGVDDVEAYLREQKEARSANAANKERKNLLAMFNKGRHYGYNCNPVAFTDYFPHDRKAQFTPTIEMVLHLIASATRKERVFLYSYIYTGARRSEIYRWKWAEDINFEQQTYRLTTRKTRDGNLEEQWFKMPPELYDELIWWYENRTIKESPYVFTDDRPGPHYGEPYKVRRRFMSSLCTRAKVPVFGFHGLRRFFASRLKDLGKSTKRIQYMLRHKNLTTTERYIHLISDDKEVTKGLLDLEN